ncbi:MAG: hypothetical protein ACR2MC_05265 [Actinomycetota bacterium]
MDRDNPHLARPFIDIDAVGNQLRFMVFDELHQIPDSSSHLIGVSFADVRAVDVHDGVGIERRH